MTEHSKGSTKTYLQQGGVCSGTSASFFVVVFRFFVDEGMKNAMRFHILNLMSESLEQLRVVTGNNTCSIIITIHHKQCGHGSCAGSSSRQMNESNKEVLLSSAM